jgi:hypothetical protein
VCNQLATVMELRAATLRLADADVGTTTAGYAVLATEPALPARMAPGDSAVVVLGQVRTPASPAAATAAAAAAAPVAAWLELVWGAVGTDATAHVQLLRVTLQVPPLTPPLLVSSSTAAATTTTAAMGSDARLAALEAAVSTLTARVAWLERAAAASATAPARAPAVVYTPAAPMPFPEELDAARLAELTATTEKDRHARPPAHRAQSSPSPASALRPGAGAGGAGGNVWARLLSPGTTFSPTLERLTAAATFDGWVCVPLSPIAPVAPS